MYGHFSNAHDSNDLRKRDYIFGLLTVYERQKTEFLADAFVKAYQQTTPRYVELMRYVQDGGDAYLK